MMSILTPPRDAKMTKIVIIRPGCTDYDEQQRIQGSLELPLNSRGRRQVEQLAEELADADLDAIYSDDSEPARSTATALGESLGVPVKWRDELRNLSQGLWEGLVVDDVQHKYPKIYKQWRDSPEKVCPPEGEPVSEAVERIRKVLKRPIKRKSAIGIIASEPLATLISCVVRDEKPEFPCPPEESPKDCRVEMVRINGDTGSVQLHQSDLAAITGNGKANGHGGASE